MLKSKWHKILSLTSCLTNCPGGNIVTIHWLLACFLGFLFFSIENVSHLEITEDIIYDDIDRDEEEIFYSIL